MTSESCGSGLMSPEGHGRGADELGAARDPLDRVLAMMQHELEPEPGEKAAGRAAAPTVVADPARLLEERLVGRGDERQRVVTSHCAVKRVTEHGIAFELYD